MVIRSLLAVALALVVAAALVVRTAHAKGSSAIVAATLSGGKLTAPKTIAIHLPESLDDMFEIEAPQSGVEDALPYALTLHYDFGEEGGRRDWSGRFDGVSALYFPESMIVHNGVWKAGWYTAVDVLALALSGALAPPRPLLPATGAGPAEERGARGAALAAVVLLGMTGSSFAFLAAVWCDRRSQRHAV